MPDKTDLDRLIKLLKMTTVEEDPVKLVAIRKANEELTKLGADWDTLLRGKVTIIEDPFKSMKSAPPPPPVVKPTVKPVVRPQPAAKPQRPRYTSAQGAPSAKGTVRYNNFLGCDEIFDGTVWKPIHAPSNPVHVPPHKKNPPRKLRTGGKLSLDDALDIF